ncbi:SitI3 family protein [Micromonospora sp. NPDC048830]|uniref:SitI3 family protein n=1 Tax=Micromonospora sp. NPDC048830 TaxID=3364257 RepID=UPI003711A205
MADEFDFHASTTAHPEHLAQFLARALDAETVTPRFLRRDRMHVDLIRLEDPADQDPIAPLLGFTHRVTVTYRLLPSSDEGAYYADVRAMVDSVLGILDHFGGDGVLLFNGEHMLIEALNGYVVFDSEWDDFRDVPELAEVARRHELRRLAQPLL